jgi:hypothetical protein
MVRTVAAPAISTMPVAAPILASQAPEGGMRFGPYRPPITGFKLTNSSSQPLTSARVYAKTKDMAPSAPGTEAILAPTPGVVPEEWTYTFANPLMYVVSLRFVVVTKIGGVDTPFDFSVEVRDEKANHTIFLAGLANLTLQRFVPAASGTVAHFKGQGFWIAGCDSEGLVVD